MSVFSVSFYVFIDLHLTNNSYNSNCTLLMDAVTNTKSSNDLCFENIEKTVLEKSDAQGMLDESVKSSVDINRNDCEYI